MLLYLSGPIAGYPDHNYPAFHEATTRLRKCGYEVLSPAELGVVEGWSWAQYMRRDIPELCRCDGVATLPHWRDSHGATLECHIADKLSMVVNPVEWWEGVAVAEAGPFAGCAPEASEHARNL